MGQNGEKKQRIKIWMGACLIIVALTVDIVELVLEWLGIGVLTNVITTIPFTLIFWLWFLLLDVPFMASPKRFFTFATTCFIEIIPGLDAVGGFFWTAGTALIVLMVRAEDSGGIIGDIAGATTAIMQRKFSSFKGAASVLNHPIETTLITTKDIAKEAAKRKAGRSKEEYERAIGLTAGLANQAIERGLTPKTRRRFKSPQNKSQTNTFNQEREEKNLQIKTERAPNTLDLRNPQ